jgi:hypothetical protein
METLELFLVLAGTLPMYTIQEKHPSLGIIAASE